MPESALEPDAYMEAFMNGFDFVLLAMRGRLLEAKLPDAERIRLEGFLADYARLAKAYRERRPDPQAARIVVQSLVSADLQPGMAN